MKHKIVGSSGEEDWIPPPPPCVPSPQRVEIAEDQGVLAASSCLGSSNPDSHTNSALHSSTQEQSNVYTSYE